MRHVALGVLALTFFVSALAVPQSYQKWLDQDAAYITTDGERQTFLHLKAAAERERFIQQFWSRRNPLPGQPENPFQEEHYRRITFANEHFGAGVPGWRTDRGRVYIVLGPPDEIDVYSGTPPKELWRFAYVNGIGYLELEFSDPLLTGEYPLSLGRAEKETLLRPRAEATGLMYLVKCSIPTIVVTGSVGDVKISMPIPGKAPIATYVRVADASNRHTVQVFEETLRQPGPVYQKDILLPLGSYQLTAVVREANANALECRCTLEVK
jgi:GWxTD domain-containing protein